MSYLDIQIKQFSHTAYWLVMVHQNHW